MVSFDRRKPIIFAGLVMAIAAGLFGAGLLTYPIRPFDEARLAISAVEMSLYGNWLVTHHDGQPDLWNVKPPLMIWLQASAIKLFGYSVGAVRAPAFVAALATLGLLIVFSARSLNNWRAGVLACAVLITTGGYVQWHVTRSGDYDALLILFQTAQLVSFFRYAEHRKPADWWRFVAALILAVMTKAVAGLAPLAAIFAYALGMNMLKPLLRSGSFYGGVALFAVVVGGFYAAREMATPGYLMAVWDSEISGRMLRPLNGQGGEWHFYLLQMATKDFLPWIVLVPFCAALVWMKGEAAERRALLLMLAFAATWLLLISIARTKMFWYDAPVYPPLALVVGLGLARGWKIVKAQGWRPLHLPGLSLALFALVFALPVWMQAAKVRQENRGGWIYRNNVAYFDRLVQGQFGREITVLVPKIPILINLTRSSPYDPDERYTPVFKFYRLVYAEEHGLRLKPGTIEVIPGIRPGELVATCDEELAAAVSAAHRTTPLDQKGTCSLRKVEGQRPIGAAATTRG